ncbi:restriction endonuclease [Swaminathania salitolerans]|uniref:Restriction endonuclease n=1 Tax=Swaminathania salitolerans TaxID=182838 RepID=A0A511BPK6_9PROT|nr:restriction endonuclease [Swaminathania salitolerans]GBQ11014.1 restriction endonuclease [Swaminathania salitolerans LMG 21291]GEL02269.1 restriction endonuclease [Swaminathania salitolerans]
MTIPTYQDLMLPVLRLAATGEQRVTDAAEHIADELGLSAEEREALLPSGNQRVLHNRIHWAKSYMTKAGLIASPRRGWFVATGNGIALLDTNPAQLGVNELKNYRSFNDFYNGQKPAEDESAVSALPLAESPQTMETATPEEQIETACQAMHSALRTELLERIVQNSPAFFERLIVDLLIAMGYGGSQRSAATQLGRSGDGGVDGVINEDRLGLDRVYVQAKRYADATIGRPDVQGFVGSLVGHGATKGVFVTTSGFSNQAREYVRHLTQRVILIDGERLTELMIEYGVGVRLSRAIAVKRLDEDFFTGE